MWHSNFLCIKTLDGLHALQLLWACARSKTNTRSRITMAFEHCVRISTVMGGFCFLPPSSPLSWHWPLTLIQGMHPLVGIDFIFSLHKICTKSAHVWVYLDSSFRWGSILKYQMNRSSKSKGDILLFNKQKQAHFIYACHQAAPKMYQ